LNTIVFRVQNFPCHNLTTTDQYPLVLDQYRSDPASVLFCTFNPVWYGVLAERLAGAQRQTAPLRAR
tara:strand:- start:123596 stop:123796 length:201 start_codon:yes stop_codon:yes gene_type:complete